MIVRDYRQIPGGWEVEVEVPGAYNDGSSRFETHRVAGDATLTPDEVCAVLVDTLLEPDPMGRVLGVDLRAWRRERAAGVPTPLANGRRVRA